MGVLNINVEIVSGNNIGGVYPFVVACFDNDLNNELHKTGATTAGPRCVWESDNTFSVDLTTAIKNLNADGKPEPTYLTFFAFDTGAPRVPSLGSCGVLLATVRDKGIAKGDFPMVNGTGSLTIIVSAEKGRAGGWFQSDKAKIAGTVGAVGLGALAAGFGAMALNKRREKKKNEKAAEEAAEGEDGEEEDDDPEVEHPDDEDAGAEGAGAGAEEAEDRTLDPAQLAGAAGAAGVAAGAVGAAGLAAGAAAGGAVIPDAAPDTQAELAAQQQAAQAAQAAQGGQQMPPGQPAGPGQPVMAQAPPQYPGHAADAGHAAAAAAAVAAAAPVAGHAGGAALPPSAAAAVGGGQDTRPWWDPETSGDDEEDEDPASTPAGPSAPGGYPGHPGQPGPSVYGQQAAPYQQVGGYGRPELDEGHPDPYAERPAGKDAAAAAAGAHGQ